MDGLDRTGQRTVAARAVDPPIRGPSPRWLIVAALVLVWTIVGFTVYGSVGPGATVPRAPELSELRFSSGQVVSAQVMNDHGAFLIFRLADDPWPYTAPASLAPVVTPGVQAAVWSAPALTPGTHGIRALQLARDGQVLVPYNRDAFQRSLAERNGSIVLGLLFVMAWACGPAATTLFTWRSRTRREPVDQDGPPGRLTDEVRRAIAAARAEATELGASAVGTDHLLRAVLAQHDTAAVIVLERMGVRPTRLWREIAPPGTPEDRPASSAVRVFTPGAAAAVRYAQAEAPQMGNAHLGTEHLLLSLIAESEDHVTNLRRWGATADRTRTFVKHLHRDWRPKSSPSASRIPGVR